MLNQFCHNCLQWVYPKQTSIGEICPMCQSKTTDYFEERYIYQKKEKENNKNNGLIYNATI